MNHMYIDLNEIKIKMFKIINQTFLLTIVANIFGNNNNKILDNNNNNNRISIQIGHHNNKTKYFQNNKFQAIKHIKITIVSKLIIQIIHNIQIDHNNNNRYFKKILINNNFKAINQILIVNKILDRVHYIINNYNKHIQFSLFLKVVNKEMMDLVKFNQIYKINDSNKHLNLLHNLLIPLHYK